MTWEVVLLAALTSLVCFYPERVCAFIFPSCLAPCTSTVAGSHAGSWQTDRDELPTNRRMGRRVPFRPLPSRAESCSLEGACGRRRLLDLLVTRFAPIGPIVLGIDDTIERRRGQR